MLGMGGGKVHDPKKASYIIGVFPRLFVSELNFARKMRKATVAEGRCRTLIVTGGVITDEAKS